jgi:hypothetical protein
MQTIATRVAGKGSPRRPTKAPRSRSMAPPARRRSRD